MQDCCIYARMHHMVIKMSVKIYVIEYYNTFFSQFGPSRREKNTVEINLSIFLFNKVFW